MHSTFMDKVMSGETNPDEIDNYVDMWHNDPNITTNLPQYLGLNNEEYQKWITGASIEQLIKDRISRTT